MLRKIKRMLAIELILLTGIFAIAVFPRSESKGTGNTTASSAVMPEPTTPVGTPITPVPTKEPTRQPTKKP